MCKCTSYQNGYCHFYEQNVSDLTYGCDKEGYIKHIKPAVKVCDSAIAANQEFIQEHIDQLTEGQKIIVGPFYMLIIEIDEATGHTECCRIEYPITQPKEAEYET